MRKKLSELKFRPNKENKKAYNKAFRKKGKKDLTFPFK